MFGAINSQAGRGPILGDPNWVDLQCGIQKRFSHHQRLRALKVMSCL